jgi:hypothetical protein
VVSILRILIGSNYVLIGELYLLGYNASRALLGLFSYPEDGGNVYLSNFG